MKLCEIEEFLKRLFFFNVILSFVFNKIYKYCIYLLCFLYMYIFIMFFEFNEGYYDGWYKVVVKRMGIEDCFLFVILF